VAAIVCVWTPGFVSAHPDTAWVRRYDGTAGSDEAHALTTDEVGNVYVTGESRAATDGQDWVTIKYLPSGDTAWTRRANGWGNADDIANAIAVDRSGNVIVTGMTTNTGSNVNIATIKYAPDGSLVYVKEYDGPAQGSDIASAVVTDAAGNAYVTGVSAGAGTGNDWVTIKYLPAGDTAWVRRANGWGNGDDEAYDVAVDRSGNVIVTGYTTSTSANLNCGTVKYRPDGSLVYVKEYDGPAHDEDAAYALALDTAGNAYVTGASVGAVSVDCITICYLPSGDTAWARRYNGEANGDDYAFAVTTDPAGNALVAGYSVGSTSGKDWLVIKYMPSGDTAWVRRANGWGNSGDEIRDIAVGPTGDVFATGYTTNVGANVNYGTIKALADGSPGWVEEYDGPGADVDRAQAVAVDGAGNVFVTGTSRGSGTGFDYATVKYAATPGVEENSPAQASCRQSEPSLVRTTLRLRSSDAAAGYPLYDRTGRAVRNLRPGDNDLSGLASGVYFIRPGGLARTSKVLVLR
jgi:uncharacterized delta-60 repeat protein